MVMVIVIVIVITPELAGTKLLHLVDISTPDIFLTDLLFTRHGGRRNIFVTLLFRLCDLVAPL